MNNKKIAIFDSGVGGLTTVKYLQELLPKEDLIFYGDQKNVPYGTKTVTELQTILKRIIDYFEKLDVKMIVVACNTAGTQIEYMRSLTNIPLLEPIVLTATHVNEILKTEKDPKILLLATDRTIKQAVYQQYLKYPVIGVPAPELVTMAENHCCDQEVIRKIVGKYKHKVDLTILGCTHFGYFKNDIQSIVDSKHLIESSYELAVEVKKYLEVHKLLKGDTLRLGSCEIIKSIEKDA